MPDYALFGGRLRSDHVFPGLPGAGTGPIDWILRTAPGPEPSGPAELLGDDTVEPGVGVRMYRHVGGFRLEYDDTGTFDITGGGRDITWTPGRSVRGTAVEADLTGRVLASALHVSGVFCLHGSAVTVGGAGIVFAGHKRFGKSTLAYALLQAAAAKLASDDVVPIVAGPPALLTPGFARPRLWRDSATHLAVAGQSADGDARRKLLLDVLPATRSLMRPVPLSAIYLLAPREPRPDQPAARRIRCTTPMATVAMIGCAKLGSLLGKGEAVVLLRHAASVAATVPVYTLEYVRDFTRLDEVIGCLLRWHVGDVRGVRPLERVHA